MSADAGSVEERGLYTAPDLASYLRASVPIGQWSPGSERLHAWVRGDVLAPGQQQTPGRDRLLSFEDLVSSQAVALLRKSGLTLADIQKAEQYFAGLYGVRRPYAHRQFWTEGRSIIGHLGDLLIAGNRGGQLLLGFVAEWMTPVRVRLGFDDRTGLAVSWRPDDRIELDPHVQFGSPCLEATSVPTSALWSYVRGGDPIEVVARSYGLTVPDVERAVSWEDRRRHDDEYNATLGCYDRAVIS
jgi:uncharacterized protein (DUF433 family)